MVCDKAKMFLFCKVTVAAVFGTVLVKAFIF